jgi:hypothetical protein
MSSYFLRPVFSGDSGGSDSYCEESTEEAQIIGGVFLFLFLFVIYVWLFVLPVSIIGVLFRVDDCHPVIVCPFIVVYDID